MPELLSPLTRRSVVASAGAASLVGAAPLGLLAHAAAAAAATTVRLGVLTPSGTSFAGSGQSLLDGLAVGFAQGSTTATLDSRPVAYGYLGARDAAAELVAAGAEVIVAGVSAPVADRLGELCTEAAVGLVVANVGGHVVADAPTGDLVLHNSLQHWQSSLSMGQWASRRLGTRLFMVVAVPDAGYDTVFAVRRGFQTAGGTFVGRALTHDTPQDDGVAEAVRVARRSRADVISVSASGRRAADIVRACRAAGLEAELVVDSLALEDFALGDLGRAAARVHSVASWTRTADTKANRDFVKAYRAGTGRQPDAFSALGHDTALLIAEGARRLATSGAGWSQLARSLAGATVPGARGTQVVHQRLGTVSTPLAVRQVRLRNGKPVNEVVVERPRAAGTPPSLGALEHTEVAAYVNEYLGT